MNISKLHEEAMDLADQAWVKRREGSEKEFVSLSRLALEKEQEAALALSEEYQKEPTRSVLFRSAATLALDCGLVDEAERLVARGLSGFPPQEIREELKDIFEQINFARHLNIKNVVLSTDEFQFSLSGSAIGLGRAPLKEFLDRAKHVTHLILRSAERLRQIPFRDYNASKRRMTGFEFFLTVPREASFAVSYKIGTGQQVIEELSSVSDSISSVVKGIRYVNDEDEAALLDLIPDETYRANFVALAKQIAPDGDNVRQIGFTAYIKGREERASFTRTRSTIKSLQVKNNEDSEQITLEGKLEFADGINEKHGKIKILVAGGAAQTVIVSRSMLDDIVRPLWGMQVRVDGVRLLNTKEINLTDISAV
jgi:hypothetical protein